MQVLLFEDEPNQSHGIALGSANYEFHFTYNRFVDRFSFTAINLETQCPIVSGKFINVGMDMLNGTFVGYQLRIYQKSGVLQSPTSFYQRMTIGDENGLPDVFMVLGTTAEFAAFDARTSGSNNATEFAGC